MSTAAAAANPSGADKPATSPRADKPATSPRAATPPPRGRKGKAAGAKREDAAGDAAAPAKPPQPQPEPEPEPAAAGTTPAPETPAPETGADTAPAPAPEHPVQAAIEAISERVKACMAQLKETDAILKGLAKDTKKLCKKRASSGKPSNLTHPLGISKELAKVIGVPEDTMLTRGAVTKAINEYAVRQKIKLPDNGRIIKLDDELAALLGKAKGDEIPIISVQTHLRDHYRKPDDTPEQPPPS